MRFRNVKVPEGINVSRHNPLLDLLLLGLGAALSLIFVMLVLIWLGGALGRHLPVAWENRLADLVIGSPPAPEGEAAARVTAALQAMADRLAPALLADEDTRIVLHYWDDDTVNAFATLGGNIFVSRGLIARMPSENALAMVIAHEIAHVTNRDVMAAMSGVVMLQLVSTLVFTQGADQLASLLGPTSLLASRGFGREAERQADAAALRAVVARYGHVAGAGDLFEIIDEMRREAGREEPPAFLSTHPVTAARIAAIRDTAVARGWPLEGATRPLPGALTGLSETSP